MKDIGSVKIPTPAIDDNATIRLGMMSPTFPSVRTAPAGAADKRVRVGHTTPAAPRTPDR